VQPLAGIAGLNPAAAWLSVYFECCLLSGNRLIPRPEELCWVHVYVTECDQVQQSPTMVRYKGPDYNKPTIQKFITR